MALPIHERLAPSVIRTYIAYSLGFNHELTLVLGCWFGSNVGFSRIVRRIVSGIISDREN